MVSGKRKIFNWYREELSGWNNVTLNPHVEGLENSYWMSTVVFDAALGATKEKLVPLMREHGVDTRPFFYPLSAIPAFRDTPEAATARQRNRNAYAIAPYGINLPSALNLERGDVENTVRTLRDSLTSLGVSVFPSAAT